MREPSPHYWKGFRDGIEATVWFMAVVGACAFIVTGC